MRGSPGRVDGSSFTLEVSLKNGCRRLGLYVSPTPLAGEFVVCDIAKDGVLFIQQGEARCPKPGDVLSALCGITAGVMGETLKVTGMSEDELRRSLSATVDHMRLTFRRIGIRVADSSSSRTANAAAPELYTASSPTAALPPKLPIYSPSRTLPKIVQLSSRDGIAPALLARGSTPAHEAWRRGAEKETMFSQRLGTKAKAPRGRTQMYSASMRAARAMLQSVRCAMEEMEPEEEKVAREEESVKAAVEIGSAARACIDSLSAWP